MSIKKASSGSLVRRLFKSVEPALIRTQLEERKLPAGRVVDHMEESLGLSLAEVSFLLDASTRTIERRIRAAATLGVAEGDRAYRLARIADLAAEMLGDGEAAKTWLRMPSRYLGGETPLAMLATEVGTQAVEESLYAIGYGAVG